MNEKVIKLSDGSTMAVKINMLTLRLFLESPIAKKDFSKFINDKESVDPGEIADIISKMIYFIMYSNGKKITEEDALALVPIDEEDAFSVLIDEFTIAMERFGKKIQARTAMNEIAK